VRPPKDGDSTVTDFLKTFAGGAHRGRLYHWPDSLLPTRPPLQFSSHHTLHSPPCMHVHMFSLLHGSYLPQGLNFPNFP
jgi:hypothetical protein